MWYLPSVSISNGGPPSVFFLAREASDGGVRQKRKKGLFFLEHAHGHWPAYYRGYVGFVLGTNAADEFPM
jgi:hypothetical protein